jgi:hypothetical protein
MQATDRVTAALKGWANRNGVTPQWAPYDVLQLRDASGMTKAFVQFPSGWEAKFAALSHRRQAEVLDDLPGNIDTQYDANWQAYDAKEIPLSKSFLEELP